VLVIARRAPPPKPQAVAVVLDSSHVQGGAPNPLAIPIHDLLLLHPLPNTLSSSPPVACSAISTSQWRLASPHAPTTWDFDPAPPPRVLAERRPTGEDGDLACERPAIIDHDLILGGCTKEGRREKKEGSRLEGWRDWLHDLRTVRNKLQPL
jgi:hypothetical protein